MANKTKHFNLKTFCKKYNWIILIATIFMLLIVYLLFNNRRTEGFDDSELLIMPKKCPTHFYLEHDTCSRKRLYTVACLNSDQCDDLRYLICPNTVGVCNCPFYSSGYFCDCNSTSYWV